MFVSAQVALPDWVRGRGLAIFLTAYFGAMTIGSALWGEVASLKGLPFALFAAAAGAALGLALTWRQGLETGAARDLAPSMHWRAPAFVQQLEDDQGPILMVAEYRIDPADTAEFLALMPGTSTRIPRTPAGSLRPLTSTRCSSSNTAAPARRRPTN